MAVGIQQDLETHYVCGASVQLLLMLMLSMSNNLIRRSARATYSSRARASVELEEKIAGWNNSAYTDSWPG
ncbi:hypothetical protein AAFF_G00323300 [Aldrovandia affinis]|uniref:Uncharacterized protein n=1 Tax=Aldrovandia affinis TaxID=143900 RepID=A0AAD7SMD0_9TELE|nr:hypothetical protein AAFF_G00323300 [Aldrovandia affinis]